MVEKKLAKDQHQYEVSHGNMWKRTLEGNDLLFKFYDESVKEEKEKKRIKDDDIFPSLSQIQRIKIFNPNKKDKNKNKGILENDSAVFIKSLQQYATVRKALKPESEEN